jgi:hypothetical protein
MKSFYLTNSILYVYLHNGSTLTIFLNADSGKAYYRFKIKTVSQVKHTGIYLGTDMFGTHYVMHNHYDNGRPCIVALDDFTKGQDFYAYDIISENSPLRIIEIGLNEILRGERYDAVSYNCQTFVNLACLNRRKSADVEKWAARVFFGSLALLGIAAIAGGRR